MFHYMDYVYNVYLESSFSKAAERLHISQPSLSEAVKKAEAEAGMPIFNRKTNPVSLTEFGVEYIRSIEQIYELRVRLQSIASEFQSVRRGCLAIGASNLSCASFVSQSLARYKQKYPLVELQLFDTSTTRSLELLDRGEVDFVFTNRPVDTQKYCRVPCHTESLVVAVPKSMELLTSLHRKRMSDQELLEISSVPDEHCVTLREFKDIPFILLRSNNYLRFCTDELFRESHVEPKIVLETDRSSVSLNFARLGVGATICSNWIVSGNVGYNDLNCFKIAGTLAQRQVFVCYRRGSSLTYAASAFIEMLSTSSVALF